MITAADAAHLGGGEATIFWILGPIAIIGALGMVMARNAIHSALWLVATMFSLGIFYVMEQGPFIGFVQIIVYTGAIMILFLFVLMLVGRDSSDSVVETLRGQRVAAILLGLGFAALLVAALANALRGTPAKGLGETNGFTDNVPQIARLLFHDYVLAFEATSALLITAALGAMVLAHVERGKNEQRTQRDLSRQRFRSGRYPGALPGPGVYAYGNSAERPALLPDGSVLDIVEERRRAAELDARSLRDDATESGELLAGSPLGDLDDYDELDDADESDKDSLERTDR